MQPTVSLTELRQRLFELADRVVESGEPVVVVRNGVRLRLIREEATDEKPGRLARLVTREVVIGPPLDPHESPSEWTGELPRVAEPKAAYASNKPRRKPRK
ncbi:MAG TPA: type II toxin-antitoxin system prevent-host-death family antitoxin [Rhodanobacteraceae bacterium]|nr:type II toxin-antitoxin system prevent-host-death family antitoxin [Rhodanobacteraceae bacterium]